MCKYPHSSSVLWLFECTHVNSTFLGHDSLPFILNFTYVFSMLSPGCIPLSDLVVADLFMHLLPGMILLYLVMSFSYTEDAFACDQLAT